MKTLKLIIAAMIMVPTAALANPPEGVNPPGLNKGGDASANAAAAAAASAKATAIGVGVGIANAGGQSTSVSNSTKVDAEPAIAPSIALTSANCIGSVGGGVGAMGVVSLGFGTTVSVEDCFKMEAAKIYFSLRSPQAYQMGLKLMESTKWVREIRAAEAPTSLVPSSSPAGAAPSKPSKSGTPNDLGCLVAPDVAKSMGIQC